MAVPGTGGKYAAGPVSLLSGLNPSPNALVTYFFMIALFGMGRLPWRRGFYGLWLAVMVLVVAVKIIVPIIQAEGIRYAHCECVLPSRAVALQCSLTVAGVNHCVFHVDAL